MAIYTQTGEPVTLVRYATVAEVTLFEGRPATKENLVEHALGNYVICRYSWGEEAIGHLAYMRADGGLSELCAARDALHTPKM